VFNPKGAAMSLFAAFGVGIIFVFVFMVIISGLFMWFVAAIASSFVEVLIAFVFNAVPVLGNLIGFIIGLIVAILVIKAVFHTSFGKALLVWIFNILAALLAIAIAAMITASSFLLSRGI
jgi:hypothetical protein